MVYRYMASFCSQSGCYVALSNYILRVDAAVDSRAREERFELFQQMDRSFVHVYAQG